MKKEKKVPKKITFYKIESIVKKYSDNVYYKCSLEVFNSWLYIRNPHLERLNYEKAINNKRKDRRNNK